MNWSGAAVELLLVSDLWCPYACDPRSDRPGLLVEVVREAMADSGVSVRYEVGSWSRLMDRVERVEAPQAVLAVERDATTERRFLFMHRPIAHSQSCFYTRLGDSWIYKKPPDLAGRRLGITQGYRYEAAFEAWLSSAPPKQINRVGGVDPASRHLAMLEYRRSDVVLEDNLVVHWLSRERGKPVRQAGCLPTEDSGSYVAVPRSVKDAAEWVKRLDAGVERLRRNGRLAALLDRYAVPHESR